MKGSARSLSSMVSIWKQECSSQQMSLRQECDKLPLREAIALVERKRVVSPETYASLLRRCTSPLEGDRVHAHFRRSKLASSTYVGNHIVEMYGKCGALLKARAVLLDELVTRNVYSWTIGITAFAQNGHFLEALALFWRMLQEGSRPNAHTFSIVIAAACSLRDLAKGKALHACFIDSGLLLETFVGNSLVAMYGACGSLNEAWQVFLAVPEKDHTNWTSIITACVQLGEDRQAVKLFRQMDLEGVRPDEMTYASLIEGCGNLAEFTLCREMHVRLLRSGLQLDVVLSTAILNMYSKCGRVDEASEMFNSICDKNIFTWTVMLAAYAYNGHSMKALKLFWKLEQEGVRATATTFVTVLQACSHSGLMDQAYYYFVSMQRERGLEMWSEHYGCIVDLLGRVGWLAEAEELLDKMPCKTDAVLWTVLLGACKMHGDAVRAERAADEVLKLAPKASSAYVLLGNSWREIAARAGPWSSSSKIYSTAES